MGREPPRAWEPAADALWRAARLDRPEKWWKAEPPVGAGVIRERGAAGRGVPEPDLAAGWERTERLAARALPNSDVPAQRAWAALVPRESPVALTALLEAPAQLWLPDDSIRAAWQAGE